MNPYIIPISVGFSVSVQCDFMPAMLRERARAALNSKFPVEFPLLGNIPIVVPCMGVSQNYGYLVGGPYSKDYSIFWGLYWVPLFGETTI